MGIKHKPHLLHQHSLLVVRATNGMLQEYLQKINETEEKRYVPVANKLFKRLADQFNQSAFEVIL